jgi:hypothetical protein
VRVAFATCSLLPDGFEDDRATARLLGADFCVWDDPAVEWDRYDRVVLRSVFDYQHRVDLFLEWCRSVGPRRLRNSPDLVEFNADKRYLSTLGLPIVPTTFLAPGEALPDQDGEFVIKPHVSAGARDTGRFSVATRAEACALVDRIHARGSIALVQPYLSDVDARGETSLVVFGGRLSHVLRKRAVLRRDEVAPVAKEGPARGLGVAQAMLEEDLVLPGEANERERDLGERSLAVLSERFRVPLYLRVDLARGDDAEPVVMELEAIEPALYLASDPSAAERFATAVRAS